MESPAIDPRENAIQRSAGRPATLDASIAHRLKAVASRLRGYILLEGLAWTIGLLLVAIFAQFALDYFTRGLRWSIRAALLAAILVAVAWIAWHRLIRPLCVRIDQADIANLVERRFPHLASTLISAVRFARGEYGSTDSNSPLLAAAVIRRAATVAGTAKFRAVLDARRAKWSGLAIVASLAILFSAVLAAPSLASLWFSRNVLLRDVPWPKRTYLVVEAVNGEIVGARADDLVIEATAEGVQPGEVEFFYQTVAGQRGRETMVTVGSAGAYRYRYSFKNARDDFEFYLRGGDDQTEPFRVRLVDRPAVEASRISVVPPSYSGLDPFTLPLDERATQVLPGSDVTIRVETNKPVVEAGLYSGNRRVAEAATSDSALSQSLNNYEVLFSPEATATYHFALRDELGFEDREPTRFAIRVIRDEPPRVRLKIGSAGEMITPQAILPIELDYADTYGLATADLFYRLTHEDTREDRIPVEGFEPRATTFKTSLHWPVSASGGVPGDRLNLFAQARDFDDVSGPNEAASPEAAFRVVTPDELYAELARREQEFRMDFERLIDAQEQLRGRLLTLMGPAAPPAGSAEFSAAIADAERRQRSVAQSVGVIRQQVEQVLAELRVNQLSNAEVEDRLGGRIAEPLGYLTTRDFPAAADVVRRWGREVNPGTGDAGIERAATTAAGIDGQQVAILSQMREILANMIQWEGYQEAVSMLRDILRLQNELKSETQEAITKQAGDIFKE